MSVSKAKIMKIEPCYVSFEQAKLLKEKRFGVPCQFLYVDGKYRTDFEKEGELFDNRYPSIQIPIDWCLAPEQWQVLEWLRVNHGIWIWVRPYKDHAADNNDPIQHQMNVYKNGVTVSKEFSSHEEAYSAAFDYILKELI
jgi:hypothetical protein